MIFSAQRSKNHLLKVAVISTLLYGLYLPCHGQALKDSVWIQSKDGCKVLNPNPLKKETISWSGECIDGYASGNGTLIWFKNGKQNQQYIGQMKRGMPNGNGEYTYSTGITYKGIYTNGRLDGIGEIIRRDKNDSIVHIFNGQLNDDDPNGYGEEIYLHSDGDTSSVYKGNFSSWSKHGLGLLKEYVSDGVIVIKGHFNHDSPEGRIEIWKYQKNKIILYYNGNFNKAGRNGLGEEFIGSNKYSGEWINNEKSGKGSLFLDSLLIYEGEWKNNTFNGIGKRYFLDGASYVGEFKNNLRDGFGIQYWKDGKHYVGEFKKDLFMGRGYIINKNIITLSGSWINGSLTQNENGAITKKYLDEKYKVKLQQLQK